MTRIIISIVTIFSICILAILLNITTPLSSGPLGILMIFVFAYLSLVGIFAYILYISSKVISHLSTTFVPRKPMETLSFRRSYYYSTVFASGPIMLVGLSSVGSIGIYEIFLIIIFIIIGCLYVSKRIK